MVEQSEPPDEGTPPPDPQMSALRGRWSLVTAIVLSATTLASAWSGYEATRWSGHAHDLNREANKTRFAAQRQADMADRQMLTDIQTFTTWFGAEVTGEEAVADAVRERFRPELLPAFEAWLGDAPADDLPPDSPFTRPEYVLASQAESDRLSRQADELVAEADRAADVSESYVLVAVLYASVLFLAGIANQMTGRRAIQLTGILAVVAFVVAVAVTATQPVSVPWTGFPGG